MKRINNTSECPSIVVIGFAVPEVDFDKATKLDAYPQVQGNKLMWRIVNGIEWHAPHPIDLIGSVPASDFPRNRNVFFGFKKWSHKVGSSDVVIPFVNIFFIKHVTRFFSTFISLCAWLIKKSKCANRHVLIYAMHSPYIFAVVLAKIFFQFKATLIVPDMPGFMNIGIKIGAVRQFAKIVDAFVMGQAVNVMDGFVVLTKHAGNAIGPSSAPKLVVEGAVSLDELPSLSRSNDVLKNNKIVMYTGALVGLEILLDAFKLIEDKNIRLWLSGKGPMEAEVIYAENHDHRIEYLGFLPTEELEARMAEATVFINARSISTPFIAYSFPSKLLEYMATGRPTISTALPGIPDEYHEYLFMLHEDSPERLARLIVEVCNRSAEELDAFGRKARDFVREKKNYVHQGERIYTFMRTL